MAERLLGASPSEGFRVTARKCAHGGAHTHTPYG